MWQQRQSRRSSLRESIKALESDIHHANDLVAGLPRDITWDCVQMKLNYSPLAPILLFVLEWMDCSCLDTFLNCLGLFDILVYRVYVDGMPVARPEERKATLEEFYNVIYPMLKQLEGNVKPSSEVEENEKGSREDEEECGICMEMDGKVVVLPNCGHSMCVGCFNEWYVRSRSCPFCRGSLKSVESGDLWVLTSNSEVVDATTLAKYNLTHFYLYIQTLPLVHDSDHNLLMYNYLM